MIRKFFLPMAITLTVWLMSAASALACSCMGNPPPCQAYGNTAAVFVGTPIELKPTTVKHNESGRVYEYPQRVFVFRVEEGFRGVEATEVQVTTGMGGGDCGYNFQIGERYIVYAGRDANNTIITSICTRTRPLIEAGEDLEYIRNLSRREPGAFLSGEIRRYRRNLETEQTEQLGPLSDVEIVIEGAGKSYNVRTDEAGRYKLTGLASGSYKVKPILSEKLSGYDLERSVTLIERGCAVASFSVTDNGRISGRVVDANGQPVPRMMVDLIPASQADSERPKSMYNSADDEGRYELKFVPPGNYLLGIRLNGLGGPDDPEAAYPRTYYPGVAQAQDALIISIGESDLLKNVDLRLPPRLGERTISGRVILPDGSPAAKAMVARREVAYTARGLSYGLTADDQGNFSFKGYEGISYYVSAYMSDASGRQRHAEPVDVPPTGPVKDIVLMITEPNGSCQRCRDYRYGQNQKKRP